MFNRFLSLVMSAGLVMSGCGGDTKSVTVEQIAATGDAVSVTDDAMGSDTQSSTEDAKGSADESDVGTDTDVVNLVVPESEPDVSEGSGDFEDPTEDPSGDESSFYEFEAWNIPAHSPDEDDNR